MLKHKKVSRYLAQDCLKNSLLLLTSSKMLENSKNNQLLVEKHLKKP